ncbi:hypothetical protein D3C73_1060150 [compost metagenome]
MPAHSKAHFGGLFAAGWTPGGGGLAYPCPSEGFYENSAPVLPSQRPSFECPCPTYRWKPGTNIGKSTARGCAVGCVGASRTSRTPALFGMRSAVKPGDCKPNTPVGSWPRCCKRKFAWVCFDARRHLGGGAARHARGRCRA